MIDSEIIVEKVNEQARKMGWHWVKIVKILPPNGGDNWKVTIDVGVASEKLKIIFFDKNGKFIGFE